MRTTSWLALALLTACGDVELEHTDDDEAHEHGLITTITLHFTPVAGGETLSFSWSDPEDDGSPEVDDIVLPDASEDTGHLSGDYLLDVELFNDLVDPVEDVTTEIAEEGSTHQLFFTGDAVDGPATSDASDALITHAYADTDADGLPIGLENDVSTLARGTGELTVTLRHLPAEDGTPIKAAGLAEEVADGGFSAIGGDSDVSVSFSLTVE